MILSGLKSLNLCSCESDGCAVCAVKNLGNMFDVCELSHANRAKTASVFFPVYDACKVAYAMGPLLGIGAFVLPSGASHSGPDMSVHKKSTLSISPMSSTVCETTEASVKVGVMCLKWISFRMFSAEQAVLFRGSCAHGRFQGQGQRTAK